MRKLSSLYSQKTAVPFGVLWAYLWVICTLQSRTLRLGAVLACGALSFVLAYGLMYALGALLGRGGLRWEPRDGRSTHILGLVIFLVTLAVCGLNLWGCYPGGLTMDTEDQYTQALYGAYSNWHPVLHTLLYFTLPIKLYNSYPFLLALQLLYFSLAFAYLAMVLDQNGMPRIWLWGLCIYIWLNPYLSNILLYLWKDIAMMTFSLVLAGQYIQIVCSKGAWLEKKRNLALFALVAVICGYLRHNAILFVGPLVAFSLFYMKNKRMRISAVAMTAVCICLVQLLYGCFEVKKPSNRIVETVGMPATIWCHVMHENPDALPEEMREVMLEIAPQEVYDQVYVDGSFNSVKWDGRTDLKRLDAMSYLEVLDYTVQCFRYAPEEAFEGFSRLTDQVWGLQGDILPMDVVVSDNALGVAARDTKDWKLQMVEFLTGTGLGRTVFGSLGFFLLAFVALGAALFANGRAGILHALPLLCYSLGTMLLLSGPDYRFFLLNLPLWMPVLFLMLKDTAPLPWCREREGSILKTE